MIFILMLRLIYRVSRSRFSLLRSLLLCGAILSGQFMPFAKAETITIGKGSGIVWEGLPFNVSLSGALMDTRLRPHYAILAISDSSLTCQDATILESIGGYDAYPIAPGIGLIPRATGLAHYLLFDGVTNESLSGTLGLPSTEGIAGTTPVTAPIDNAWCLAPRDESIDEFYNAAFIRTAIISGTWVMVADGTQTNMEVSVPIMYAGSFSSIGNGDRSSSILPSNIILRVSVLTCEINTPTEINFGTVERNSLQDSELGSRAYELNVSCTQGDELVNSNINLQFHPISGLYNSNSHQLALDQGGGYITGEINNAVTGSGNCGGNSGVSFDDTPYKIGEITEYESSEAFSNQVTWRLCSGGASLPTGAVTASADMIVTFN